MKNKSNFIYLRKQKAYEREISLILYQIIRQNQLPFFSLSYCKLSQRGESLKIYLNSFWVENKKELLKLINQKYTWEVKKELVQGKKSAFIPNLIFFWDEKLEKSRQLTEIIQKFNIKNER